MRKKEYLFRRCPYCKQVFTVIGCKRHIASKHKEEVKNEES